METLDQLLYWRGIASDYFNYKGEQVTVPLENRKALLRAMGVDPEDTEAVAKEAFELDVAPWLTWVQSFQVIERHKECCFFVNVAPDELDLPFEYAVWLEDGSENKGSFTPALQPEVGDYVYEGTRYSRRVVMCGDLPLGYHKLTIRASDKSVEGDLVVVPEKAYVPKDIDKGARVWGIIVQLYTLRTERNWGIGDLSDLNDLVKKSAAQGADIIGLNPLHALCTPNEYHCSPYSPSDRRYIEPLYIDPTKVDEFTPEFMPSAEQLENVRHPESVDYAAVFALKFSAFKPMFSIFKERHLHENTARGQGFLRFVEREGAALHDYCVYQVLRNQGKTLDSLEASPLDASAQDAVDFYAYLQWLAQTQLQECQETAEDLGMQIGLMRDLAVGADGGGGEVTTNGDLFCRAAAVGAPPDPLAEKGQNWGLPPMDPAHMRATKFAHFINLLRTNMTYCGALRIDHAMALMRLWWCPPGKTADFGAYIYYPFPEMLGLLKLESVRNRCMIIGEDMGVVPDEFREAITAGSVFTNKLFYFEREHDGSFRLPQHYMPRALAMLTNHDVPTLASWWATSDLELRNRLNLLDDSVPYEQILDERRTDKFRLLDWLEAAGVDLPDSKEALVEAPLSKVLAKKIMVGGAKVASQIFVIQLEDLELMDAPVNVPGTSSEYPNWQRKLKDTLSEVFADDSVLSMLAEISNTRK